MTQTMTQAINRAMTPAEADRLLANAVAAMDADRASLLKGDVAAVAQAAEHRAQALESLLSLDQAGLRALAPKLADFRKAAARQLRLLTAAREGARRSRQRMEQMIDARDRVPGYDASGALRQVRPGKVLTSRRV